ncbi:MAG: hypothetical protein M5T52_24875 [Ignavibacteriaceae bacterium]|nr:hypothetical protein [Ignavibacteriaceae bacterium]
MKLFLYNLILIVAFVSFTEGFFSTTINISRRKRRNYILFG